RCFNRSALFASPWTNIVEGYVWRPLVGSGDVLYVQQTYFGHKLQALDINNGKLLWDILYSEAADLHGSVPKMAPGNGILYYIYLKGSAWNLIALESGVREGVLFRNNNQQNSGFAIYPNPAGVDNIVNIIFPGLNGIFEIVDITGRRAGTYASKTGRFHGSLSGLQHRLAASGTYLIRWTDTNRRVCRKLEVVP
ncbi:MAG: T9SS type A sorting domain-containing protein, partial [bacterium]